MTLGEKIYSLRIKAGFSQEDLAEKTGVSRQSVSKWETDSGVPTLDKLIQLSKIFGITLDELVGNDNVKSDSDNGNEDNSEAINNNAGRPEYESAFNNNYFINTADNNERNHISAKKIIGIIFVALSTLSIIFSLIFMIFIGNNTVPIIFLSVFLLICGILCLIIKKNSALAISVIVLILVFIFFSIFFAGFSYGILRTETQHEVYSFTYDATA